VACLTGKWKEAVPPTGVALNWIDVRDVATAHVKAGLEVPEAGGKRLFTTAGRYCNREILDIIKKNFPEYKDQLPGEEVKGGEMPPADKRYGFENSETERVLGIEWIGLEQSVVDTVKSLKSHGL
jgi:nucleoside-diphosphate-sugar epimerase